MYHWSRNNRKLGYGDQREIVAGETLFVRGHIEMCSFGLHASPLVMDAIKYAPGCYLWEVELSGEVIHGEDKSVASSRKALFGYDSTQDLIKFAKWCAGRAARAAAYAAAYAAAGAAAAAAAAAAARDARDAAYAADARAAAGAAAYAAAAAEISAQEHWWRCAIARAKKRAAQAS